MSVLDQARKQMADATLRIWRDGKGQIVTGLTHDASEAYEMAIGHHAGYLAPFTLSGGIRAVFEQPTADGVTVVLYRDGKELYDLQVERLCGGMGPLGDARHYANRWWNLLELGALYRGAHKAPDVIEGVEQEQREVETKLRDLVRRHPDGFDGLSRAEMGVRSWRRRGERHIGPLVRALTA